MDKASIITGAISTVGTLIVSALYFVPKLKRYKAETDNTTVDTLETALKSLAEAYDKKLQVVQESYQIEISSVKRMYSDLEKRMEDFKQKYDFVSTERDGYKALFSELKLMEKKCDDCPLMVKIKQHEGNK